MSRAWNNDVWLEVTARRFNENNEVFDLLLFLPVVVRWPISVAHHHRVILMLTQARVDFVRTNGMLGATNMFTDAETSGVSSSVHQLLASGDGVSRYPRCTLTRVCGNTEPWKWAAERHPVLELRGNEGWCHPPWNKNHQNHPPGKTAIPPLFTVNVGNIT